jgi:hypothetical protein
MGSVATFLDGLSQPADDANLDTSFTDRVWRLLDRNDYRRADSEDDIEPLSPSATRPLCARGRLPTILPKVFPTLMHALENRCTNHWRL